MTSETLSEFARDYAKAWSSQVPGKVAAFFAENASLQINGGPPAVGRAAIAKEAQTFMSAFPDMAVTCDQLVPDPDGTKFRWTLIGTNSGPGGSGNRVRISGYERWKFSDDGLIAKSQGHFDVADYESQVNGERRQD